MEFTQLGRTGLKVSRLCLGTMNFGPQTTEEDSFAIMDKALDLDINFFDTANVYGWKIGEGITEQIVGRWFAQGVGGDRRWWAVGQANVKAPARVVEAGAPWVEPHGVALGRGRSPLLEATNVRARLRGVRALRAADRDAPRVPRE